MPTPTICACEACNCDLGRHDAVIKNGKTYCSAACADGHQTQAGCGHEDCPC